MFGLRKAVSLRRVDRLRTQQHTERSVCTLRRGSQPGIGTGNARDAGFMHAICSSAGIQVVEHATAAAYHIDVRRLRKGNIHREDLPRKERLTGCKWRRISAIIRKQDLRCTGEASALIGRRLHARCTHRQRDQSK